MVELVDTQDLKSCDLKSRAGSIPALSTIALYASVEGNFVYMNLNLPCLNHALTTDVYTV
jgi:hypothetical protein